MGRRVHTRSAPLCLFVKGLFCARREGTADNASCILNYKIKKVPSHRYGNMVGKSNKIYFSPSSEFVILIQSLTASKGAGTPRLCTLTEVTLCICGKKCVNKQH